MNGSEIMCPFCKNTGKHLCPDVAEPVEIDCSHKQCPVMLQKEIDRLKAAATPHEKWVGTTLESLEVKVSRLTKEVSVLREGKKELIDSEMNKELRIYQFALDRFKHHVYWARSQTELRSVMNCLETAFDTLTNILNEKTPVPADWPRD